MLFSDIKRLLNRNTLLSAALVAILCFSSQAVTGDTEPPTMFELAVSSISGAEKFNYFLVLDCFDNSYWFYIILPVILSFSAVSDFYEEWFGGGFYFSLPRCGITKYVLSKSLSVSAVSVGCFLAGVTIYCLVLLIFFPNFEDTAALFTQGALVYFAAKICNIAAVIAVYPLICIVAVMCIKEKFLSLSVPLIIGYSSAKISSDLFLKSFSEQDISYQKLAMLTPYMQTKQYAYFEQLFGLPIAVWYLSVLLCCAASVLVFRLLVKRRIYNV